MVYRFFIGLAFIFTTLLISASAVGQGYSIKVKMNAYSSNALYLAYHLGAKTYIADTAIKNDEGYFVFKGEEAKHPGMYMIVTEPDKSFFEFLIPNKKEQQFSLTATYGKSIQWSASGSPENKQFQEYLQFLAAKQLQFKSLKEKLPDNEASKKKLVTEEAAINKEVDIYRYNYLKKNPGQLLTNIIKATTEIVVPAALKQQPNNAAFYYYRTHFFDNITLDDNRLLYSKIIYDKIEYYTEKLTVQDPDSVIKSIETIMNKVNKAGDKEVYQYVLIHLLNKYAASKIVCFDKVYIHIGATYYCGKNTPSWIEQAQLEKICANVESMRYSQCGTKAPSIQLTDIVTSAPIDLSAIQSSYTIVLFWLPTAKASDDEVDVLKTVYDKWHSKGLAIIGIADHNKEETSKIVAAQSIPWPCASVTGDELDELKKKYYITSYPTIYLLDANKKIVLKKIGANQLDEILAKLIN